VDIHEFKKTCISIDKAIPLLKEGAKGKNGLPSSLPAESASRITEEDQSLNEDEVNEHR
jgi:hypothetical protein